MAPLSLWAAGMVVFGLGVLLDPPKTPASRRRATLLLLLVWATGLTCLFFTKET